jgi:hypothetical protein
MDAHERLISQLKAFGYYDHPDIPILDRCPLPHSSMLLPVGTTVEVVTDHLRDFGVSPGAIGTVRLVRVRPFVRCRHLDCLAAERAGDARALHLYVVHFVLDYKPRAGSIYRVSGMAIQLLD